MPMNDHSVAHQSAPTTILETSFLAEVYRLLSLCFQYPDPSVITPSFMEIFQDLLEKLGLWEERMDMASWLETEPSLIDTLQIEYTRLFINAIPHLVAPPYASVYLGNDRSLQTRHTEKIHRFYRDSGYEIRDFSVPADHIHYQLDFLAALAEEGKPDRGEEFLRCFFRPWFSPFAQRIAAEAEIPFYRVSAQLTDIFTKEDQ